MSSWLCHSAQICGQLLGVYVRAIPMKLKINHFPFHCGWTSSNPLAIKIEQRLLLSKGTSSTFALELLQQQLFLYLQPISLSRCSRFASLHNDVHQFLRIKVYKHTHMQACTHAHTHPTGSVLFCSVSFHFVLCRIMTNTKSIHYKVLKSLPSPQVSAIKSTYGY